ncbi:DUF4333 domain-containing protein [Amycolatopsis acidicola]|uniref:DUF4333 domain-containing protein n=1 Tax=Amycolatopsis acidicola TaxID=2596893 RepID=A0A5N0VDW4_9PSEU|nr:DUF4333 domain-containing protein [Amycolatopsis acidicola]KAA9162882.1 DUF4333 domain-containing protein [Amycolatopsis acidicola]
MTQPPYPQQPGQWGPQSGPVPQWGPPYPQQQQPVAPQQHPGQPGTQQPAPHQHPGHPGAQQPAPHQHPGQPGTQQPAPQQHPGSYPGFAPGYGQQSGGYGGFGAFGAEPRKPKRGKKPWLIGGVVVVVFAAAGVGGWLSGLFSGPVLDKDAVQAGVQKVLREDFGEGDVKDVSCPADQPVKTGTTFECSATVAGKPKKISVRVLNDQAQYEVGAPK